MKKLVVFIGPPGAGKGSLSQLCQKHFNWVQLSTGHLCRKHISEQTDIGQQIDFAIKSGKLVSDSLITEMVADWLETNQDNADAVILDGFPRTKVQAETLSTLLTDKFDNLELSVVKLSLSHEAVIKRLSSRLVCVDKECQAVYSAIPGSAQASGKPMTCDKCSSQLARRSDDEADAIKERLSIYQDHAESLLGFYGDNDAVVHDLDVDKPLQDVFNDFKKLIN